MVYTKEHVEEKLTKQRCGGLTFWLQGCNDEWEEDRLLDEYGVTLHEYLDGCEMYDICPPMYVILRVL